MRDTHTGVRRRYDDTGNAREGSRVEYLWPLPSRGGGPLSGNDLMIYINETLLCGTSVVGIQGPLRVPVEGELRRSISSLLRRGGRRILLDLSRVSALDAGGVGELVAVYNMAVAAQGTVRIVNTTSRVRELLDRVGLFDLLSGNARQWSDAPQASDRVA